MRPVDVLRFIMIFFAGISAGSLVVVLIYGVALQALPGQFAGLMHAHLHPWTHRSMQTSTIVAGAAAVALAVWDDPAWRASTILLFAGLLGVAAQAILSRFWVVPMSDELIAWKDKGSPADYVPFLRSWAILHGGRVLGALEAFVCYLLAILVR